MGVPPQKVEEHPSEYIQEIKFLSVLDNGDVFYNEA